MVTLTPSRRPRQLSRHPTRLRLRLERLRRPESGTFGQVAAGGERVRAPDLPPPGARGGDGGHQPPYHALGDYTVMRPGMHFSNDPGLYDPANGFSFNHGGFPKCEVHNLNHVHCYGNAQPYTR